MVWRKVLQKVVLTSITIAIMNSQSLLTALGGENTITGVVQENIPGCDQTQPCPPLGGVRVIEEKINREDTSDEVKGGLYALQVPDSRSSYSLAYCKKSYIIETRSGRNQGSVQKREIVKMTKDQDTPKLPDADIEFLVESQWKFFVSALDERRDRAWVEIPLQNLQMVLSAIKPTASPGTKRARIAEDLAKRIKAMEERLGPPGKSVCDR